MPKDVKIAILGDDSDWNRAVRNVNDGAGKIGSSLKSMAGVAAGAFAAVGVINLGKGFVEAAEESRKVAKQTDAVLKSMGDQANVTAKQVADLAGAISLKTGVDDEAIQGGQNLLLTFGKIRNEVGKGNNIFDRATQSAVDMSVALGTDINGAAIQVGKALNDPIKGMTALSRAGVSFTQQQKDQVKQMVAAGDTLGAQKLILSELDNQFKGSAAAQASASDKMKVAFGNIQEQIGGYLLPVIDKLATWMAKTLPKALFIAGVYFGKVRDAVKQFVNAFRSGFTEDEGTKIEKVALKVRELWQAAQPFIDWVKANWKPVLAGAAAALLLFTSPVTAFVAGVVLAYTKLDWFRAFVQKAAAFIAGQFKNLSAWVKEHWDSIQEAITHVVNFLQGLWKMWGDELVSVVKVAFGFVKDTVENVMKVVSGIIEFVLAIINGDWGKAWDALKKVVSGVWDQIKNVVSTALDLLSQGISGALDALKVIWGKAWEAMGGVVSSVWDGMVGAFEAVINGIIGALEGGINAAVDGLNAAIGAIDKTLGPWLNLGEVGHVSFGRIGETSRTAFVAGGNPDKMLDRTASPANVIQLYGEPDKFTLNLIQQAANGAVIEDKRNTGMALAGG